MMVVFWNITDAISQVVAQGGNGWLQLLDTDNL